MKIDERALKAAMKQMGIKSEEIEATEVIIRCPGKEIIVTSPSVTKVNMMGQDTFQISGRIAEREEGISQEDIRTVMEQAKADETSARKALEEHKGDLAAAIMSLAQS